MDCVVGFSASKRSIDNVQINANDSWGIWYGLFENRKMGDVVASRHGMSDAMTKRRPLLDSAHQRGPFIPQIDR